MEAFSLCSLAQATELALMPLSCSRMAGRRALARSRSSRSRTTQWSHTAGRGQVGVGEGQGGWGPAGSHGGVSMVEMLTGAHRDITGVLG